MGNSLQSQNNSSKLELQSLDLSNLQDRKNLEIARKIQLAIVPQSIPLIEGLEINSFFIPCDAVGGDSFDVINISKDIVAFLIYDVTGSGVSSTLISMMAKISFARHIKSVLSPRAVFERVNMEMIRDLPAGFYFTAFLAYLDLHDNKLTYGSAGHVYPLLFNKKQSKLLHLQTQGTLLGVFENALFDEQTLHLGAGDCLLLFTNGLYQIYSQGNDASHMELEKQLYTFLQIRSQNKLIDHFKGKYESSIQSKPIEDDITVISVEILNQSRKDQIKEKLGFSADDPVYLQFLSYYEEMDVVIAVILASLDNFGYQDDVIRKMKITLTELLVNAILHGNNKDFSKKVIVGHLVDKTKAVISIMDEGSGFDYKKIPDPTLPENITKDCGRGLFIVSHYVDEVFFNQFGNRITITKYYGKNC